MPHAVNRDFTLVLAPEGHVTDVSSQRPAFAKVRRFRVDSTGSGKIVLKVSVHGMGAGTASVPFIVKLEGGIATFSVRVIG